EQNESWEQEAPPRRRDLRGRPSRAASAVDGPANALLVLGSLGAVIGALTIGLAVFGIGIRAAQFGVKNEPQVAKVFRGLPGASVGTVVGVLMIVGGIKMKKLENYGLALAASILAIIPCISPCCLLSLPFGIWSVVVLSRHDVKEAFR